jgi:PAS domain S-box-containing protein
MVAKGGRADLTKDPQPVSETSSGQERRFRATFEQAAIGIAHVGTDGRWLDVNPHLCQLLGYTREELLASTFQALTYEPDLKAGLVMLRRLLAGELATYSTEKRYIRKNGELIWSELTVAVVRDESAAPIFCI